MRGRIITDIRCFQQIFGIKKKQGSKNIVPMEHVCFTPLIRTLTCLAITYPASGN